MRALHHPESSPPQAPKQTPATSSPKTAVPGLLDRFMKKARSLVFDDVPPENDYHDPEYLQSIYSQKLHHHYYAYGISLAGHNGHFVFYRNSVLEQMVLQNQLEKLAKTIQLCQTKISEKLSPTSEIHDYCQQSLNFLKNFPGQIAQNNLLSEDPNFISAICIFLQHYILDNSNYQPLIDLSQALSKFPAELRHQDQKQKNNIYSDETLKLIRSMIFADPTGLI